METEHAYFLKLLEVHVVRPRYVLVVHYTDVVTSFTYVT